LIEGRVSGQPDAAEIFSSRTDHRGGGARRGNDHKQSMKSIRRLGSWKPPPR
jgi:hypothetical protein